MKSLFVLICLYAGILNVNTEGKLPYCPDAALVAPCTCSDENVPFFISCRGRSISQHHVTNLFQILRLHLNLTAPEDILPIGELEIGFTDLTSLDLTPLINTHIDTIYIMHNYKLINITGPPFEQVTGKIQAPVLWVIYNDLLTDEGFGNTLKYFSAEKLTHLYLDGNKIQGSNNGQEFVPGLASFQQLQTLRVMFNHIIKVEGGQFKNLTRLDYLDLSQQQTWIEIGDNAFHFEEGRQANSLIIYLTSNRLSEERFSTNHGIEKIRNVTVYLNYNLFTTLPTTLFEPMLRVGNKITLWDNQLFCDTRVSWLKAERQLFEPLVFD